MHLGIVFQGPLKFKEFDCIPLLLEYHQEVQSLKGVKVSFCLSTWSTETISQSLRDAGWVICVTPPVTDYDYMNRRKQIIGCTNGAVQLNEHCRPDFIIKIRADLKIDIRGLIGHLVDLEESGRLGERILVPVASLGLPFYSNDFFFGGRAGPMLDFLKANMEFGNIYIHYPPEMDFSLKYLFLRHAGDMMALSPVQWFLNVFDYPYVWQGHVLETKTRLWLDKLLDKYFVLTPQRIFEEALWRGRPIGEKYGIHGAIFFDTREVPSGINYGRPLAPLRPMPWRVKLIEWTLSRLEFWRWRYSIPMTDTLHSVYKFLHKVRARLSRS